MHRNQAVGSHQQKRIRYHSESSDSYTFFNLLTSEAFLDQVEALLPDHRERLFPPTETLSMFLAQVMNADRSCQNTVNDASIRRLLGGLPSCSTHTGAYCQARKRLPFSMISTLTRYTGEHLAYHAPAAWHWRSRPVRLVDGTTVSLPDTPANQAVYPQPGTQQAGLGFPQCRMVSLHCLGSGAILDMAMGPCQGKGSDEQSLLRSILDALYEGDILLGDAFYATYFLLCALQARGIDGVFEQLGARRRSTDFRCGRQLGERDHLIEWQKPSNKPDWISQAEYEQFPSNLTVREVQTGGKVLVTTFLCPKQTAKDDLKVLYKDRWQVELDLRNIKTTLGMEKLSCRTPEMVEKEIWVYLLAYNLIRLLMAQSALLADVLPRHLSFKHALQLWIVWRQQGVSCHNDELLADLFILIAQQRVGKRPGRIEPRAVKRRPKAYSLLMKPRQIAIGEIRKHGHPKKLK